MKNKTNAFLLVGDRIAPRFDKTEKILFYPAGGIKELDSCERAPVKHMKPSEVCDFLVSSKIEILVCGGLKQSCKRDLEDRGIRIIDNIIGNVSVVAVLLDSGRLASGQVVD